jgi:hypothetical protein
MNSRNTLLTINLLPDEMDAACAAFGELPKLDALPRLVMIRRAVAVGFYTDDLPLTEQSALSVTLPAA